MAASQAPRNLPPPLRVPLLALGFVALVVGAGAGLARLGWPMPALASGAAGLHGPLMIGGFFGVVIALERAVAIGRLWAYVGPLAAGIGTLAHLAGASSVAPWFGVAGAAVLLAATLDVWRRQRALFTLTMACGAAAWAIGMAAWALGATLAQVLPSWLAFLVLTIAGERLELSRFLPPSRVARACFAAILALLLAALATPALASSALGRDGAAALGTWLFGAALLALALWLVRCDIARRTVRGRGLTRFIALCLLSGYAWLAVGAAVMLAAPGAGPGTPAHDAALHAIVLGFVFSMVFGHAPIIFPAVLKVSVPYHASFYGPLALLHASLLVRLAGDASGHFGWTRAGGALHALALAAFIAGTAAAVWRGRSRGAA